MVANVQEMAEQIKTLTSEEQQHLRALLDTQLAPTPAEQQRRLAEHLLAAGVIDHIPEGYPDGYVEPPPITVRGEPVSETILRERR